MLKSILTTLLVLGSISAHAADRQKSCMDPCGSKGDFPYYSYTSTGLGYSFDLRIEQRALRGDATLALSLMVGEKEQALPSASLVKISDKVSLITIRTINAHFDKNFQRPEGLEKISLKVSLVSGGQVIGAKIIPFDMDNVQAQIFKDEPSLVEIKSDVTDAEAKLEFELIAAGGMKCRWIALPGALYCQD